MNSVVKTWYMFEMDGSRIAVNRNGDDLWPFFRRVAEVIAMSDCTGSHVIDIVYNGKRFRYVGWQPGMKFEFVNVDDPEEVYITWMEHLDH